MVGVAWQHKGTVTGLSSTCKGSLSDELRKLFQGHMAECKSMNILHGNGKGALPFVF